MKPQCEWVGFLVKYRLHITQRDHVPSLVLGSGLSCLGFMLDMHGFLDTDMLVSLTYSDREFTFWWNMDLKLLLFTAYILNLECGSLHIRSCKVFDICNAKVMLIPSGIYTVICFYLSLGACPLPEFPSPLQYINMYIFVWFSYNISI